MQHLRKNNNKVISNCPFFTVKSETLQKQADVLSVISGSDIMSAAVAFCFNHPRDIGTAPTCLGVLHVLTHRALSKFAETLMRLTSTFPPPPNLSSSSLSRLSISVLLINHQTNSGETEL